MFLDSLYVLKSFHSHAYSELQMKIIAKWIESKKKNENKICIVTWSTDYYYLKAFLFLARAFRCQINLLLFNALRALIIFFYSKRLTLWLFHIGLLLNSLPFGFIFHVFRIIFFFLWCFFFVRFYFYWFFFHLNFCSCDFFHLILFSFMDKRCFFGIRIGNENFTFTDTCLHINSQIHTKLYTEYCIFTHIWRSQHDHKINNRRNDNTERPLCDAWNWEQHVCRTNDTYHKTLT